MGIFIGRTYFFISSKDKRESTLSISQNCKSYFSQGKEKKTGYAVQWKLKLQVGLTLKGETQLSKESGQLCQKVILAPTFKQTKNPHW